MSSKLGNNNNNNNNINEQVNIEGGEMKKLPIGFRFRPTDEELVVHYLKRRALSLPLPASVIPDLPAVFTFDPLSLPGDLKEKRYYFWKRKGEIIRNKCSKVMPTTYGFWKANIGKGKQILSPGLGAPNDVVGVRKSWTFYVAKNQDAYGHLFKTRWLMHEFQLVDTTQNVTSEAGEWVVCRVFQRKTRQKNHEEAAPKYCASKNVNYSLGSDSPSFMDFKLDNNFELGPPLPTSPSSSTTD